MLVWFFLFSWFVRGQEEKEADKANTRGARFEKGEADVSGHRIRNPSIPWQTL